MAELNKLKLNIVQWITSLEDPELIHMMNSIRLSYSEQANDIYDKLSEKEQADIQKGMEDFEKGRHVSSEEFWKHIGKTLSC